jgi:hypothetical protein
MELHQIKTTFVQQQKQLQDSKDNIEWEKFFANY